MGQIGKSQKTHSRESVLVQLVPVLTGAPQFGVQISDAALLALRAWLAVPFHRTVFLVVPIRTVHLSVASILHAKTGEGFRVVRTGAGAGKIGIVAHEFAVVLVLPFRTVEHSVAPPRVLERHCLVYQKSTKFFQVHRKSFSPLMYVKSTVANFELLTTLPNDPIVQKCPQTELFATEVQVTTDTSVQENFSPV